MQPYIYQIVHIRDFKALHLLDHITILKLWSERLFGRGCNIDVASTASKIDQLLKEHGCYNEVSHFVRVTIYSTFELSVELEGTSLYDGYAMRLVTLKATTARYNELIATQPSSAREATTALSLATAKAKGYNAIIQYDSKGDIISANDSPLFAIKNNIIYTPNNCQEDSVVRRIAVKAIEMTTLQLIEQPLNIDKLPTFDEMFIFDHHGITSITHCDRTPYMSIKTERVTKQLKNI